MNELYLSLEAQTDLEEIKAYIADELENPNAALATVNRITKTLRILRTHAFAGAPLSSVTDVESDYRFLVSGNYLAFYRGMKIRSMWIASCMAGGIICAPCSEIWKQQNNFSCYTKKPLVEIQAVFLSKDQVVPKIHTSSEASARC